MFVIKRENGPHKEILGIAGTMTEACEFLLSKGYHIQKDWEGKPQWTKEVKGDAGMGFSYSEVRLVKVHMVPLVANEIKEETSNW